VDGKRPAARRRRFHGFLKIGGRGIQFLRYLGRGTDSKNRRALRLGRINYLIINYLIINYLIILNSLQLLSVCLIKNVYKMTVVCCNYAVASYVPCFHPETAGERFIEKITGGQRVTHA